MDKKKLGDLLTKEEIETLKLIENALNSIDLPIHVEVIVDQNIIATANPQWVHLAQNQPKWHTDEEAEEGAEPSKDEDSSPEDADQKLTASPAEESGSN